MYSTHKMEHKKTLYIIILFIIVSTISFIIGFNEAWDIADYKCQKNMEQERQEICKNYVYRPTINYTQAIQQWQKQSKP